MIPPFSNHPARAGLVITHLFGKGRITKFFAYDSDNELIYKREGQKANVAFSRMVQFKVPVKIVNVGRPSRLGRPKL